MFLCILWAQIDTPNKKTMAKPQNKETRYYIDIDLRTLEIIKWDYDQRSDLITHEFDNPYHYRVYTSKGQYNKLEKRYHQVTYGPL